MVGSPRRGRAAGTPIPQPPNPPGLWRLGWARVLWSALAVAVVVLAR